MLWVKLSEDCILKYFLFFFFFQKIGFDTLCKLSPKTICIKCQGLISGENKTNIINLLSAEFVQRALKVKKNYNTKILGI